MGISTKAIITQPLSPHDIATILRERYVGVDAQHDDVRVLPSKYPDTSHIILREIGNTSTSGNLRRISVYQGPGDADAGLPFTGTASHLFLDLGGDSVVMLRTVLEATGGFLLETDFDGEWAHVPASNPHPLALIENRVVAETSRIFDALCVPGLLGPLGDQESAEPDVKALWQALENLVDKRLRAVQEPEATPSPRF